MPLEAVGQGTGFTSKTNLQEREEFRKDDRCRFFFCLASHPMITNLPGGFERTREFFTCRSAFAYFSVPFKLPVLISLGQRVGK